MNRRNFILVTLGANVALLSACAGGRTPSGPAAIKWGRETCAHCGMALSDRRFAAQAQGARAMDHWNFDDVGCAAAWLERRPAAEQDTLRLWVARLEPRGADVEWLDARAAQYFESPGSPMGYNFGATDTAQAGSIGFAALRERVRGRRMGQG